jgi:hypothetical protein
MFLTSQYPTRPSFFFLFHFLFFLVLFIKGAYRLLVTETDGWQPSKLHLLNGTKGLTGGGGGAAKRKNGRMAPSQVAVIQTRESKTLTSLQRF